MPFIALDFADGCARQNGQKSAQFGHRVGASQTARAQGVFAGWGWDGRELRADVDRYGFFSLFYCVNGSRLIVSPNLLQIIAQGGDTTPDRRALGVFHRMGMFVGDDTPFKHIRVLPPGGKLVWRDGKATVSAPPPSFRQLEISRDQAVEGMIELFRASMKRVLASWPGTFRLPLSGGRDSRHILLELAHQNRLPEACVTFHHMGGALNAEAQAARAISTAVGVPHDILGQARPRMADTFRALTMTSLCADEHAQMMPLHDYFLDHRGAAFDGIAGDILTNPDNDAERFYRMAEKDDYLGIANGLFAGHGRVISQSHWRRGAGPIYSDGLDEECAAYVADEIRRYSGAPDPYQMFWLLHRTRREISFVPSAILASADAVFCPYLDEDFAEFCVSLPYSVTRDQMLHDDAIARAYPQFAHIPYQEGFTNPAPKRSTMGHKMRSLSAALQVARILAPDHPVGGFQALMRAPDKLIRGAHDMYQLHDLFLRDLDAGKAANLLKAADNFRETRPKMLISDTM